MKRNFLMTLFFCVVFALFFAGCKKSNSMVVITAQNQNQNNQTPTHANYTVYLITMDLEDSYWRLIDAGCKQAVSEIGGINYKWIAPDTHKDELQVAFVE